MKEPVQPRRFKVPVDDQNAFSVAGQDPGHVGERHRTPRPALIRIARDDLANARLGHPVLSRLSESGLKSRGRSMIGPEGGCAIAPFRNRLSMSMVISGR